MSKELEKTSGNLPAVNDDLLKQLREGSGEAQGKSFNFVPVLQVDNSTETKVIDGNEEEVLCQPRWKLTIKDKDTEELVTKPYEKSFGGVVLVIKYQVTKKYEPTSTMPFFYSNEFSPAVFNTDREITLTHQDEAKSKENITYKTFKEFYKDKYTLTAIVYVWHSNQVYKVKLHGSSLSAFWGYLKNFKGNDSVSAHPTVFGTQRLKDPKPYNTVALSVSTDETVNKMIDWSEILTAQQEINSLFQKPESTSVDAEVIPATSEEIKVDAIPFL